MHKLWWLCGLVGVGLVTWWCAVRYGWLIPSLGRLRQAPTISAKDLSTGDVIFMSGSSWTEKTIQTVTASPFSHVGVIVTEGDLRYVWEADVSGSQRRGPRMVDLATKIAEWPGSKEVYVKKLKVPVSPDGYFLRELGRMVGSPFDGSMMAWIFPHSAAWVSATKTKGSWFCSELVVSTLQRLGVPIKGTPTRYAPGRVWDLDVFGPPHRLVF